MLPLFDGLKLATVWAASIFWSHSWSATPWKKLNFPPLFSSPVAVVAKLTPSSADSQRKAMMYCYFEERDGRDDGCYRQTVKARCLIVLCCSLASTGGNFGVLSTIHYLNTCFASPKQGVRTGWRGHESKDSEFRLWTMSWNLLL